MYKLEPCSNCQERSAIEIVENSGKFYVHCKSCTFRIINLSLTKKSACKLWNYFYKQKNSDNWITLCKI